MKKRPNYYLFHNTIGKSKSPILIFVLLLLFSCNKKDEVQGTPKINSTTTLVIRARNQDNQKSILLIDVSTIFDGSDKKATLKGRAIKFSFTNSFELDNKIDAFFDKVQREDISLAGKNLTSQFEEELKVINGFVRSTEISKENILLILKTGKAELAVNNNRKSLFIEFLTSVISTPAYAQNSQVDDLVNEVVLGALEQASDCTLSGLKYSPNTDCMKSITKLAIATNNLWDFIWEEVDKALNPKNPNSANNLFNNISNIGNTSNSPSSSGGGGGWGDPHIYTFDGNYYDFQAVGEFTVCKSTVDNFNLQIRQEEYKIGIPKMVSVNTAIGFNTTSDIIFIQRNPFKIYVNKKEESPAFTTLDLKNGGTIRKNGDEILIDNNKGDKLKINLRGQYLDYVLSVSKDRKTKITGLLGNFDGNLLNDLVNSNGSVANPSNFKEFYSTFTDSWRITPEQSLFEYESGKSTTTYTDKNFPSQEFEISPTQYQLGYKTCTQAGIIGEPALSSCIYDVAITGNLGWAKNYADVQRQFSGSGLIAYYPFNNSAKDESGNNNDGQVFGATLTSDRNGKANSAYNFNGNQQFIRVPNSLELHNIGQSMTISAWVTVKEWYGGVWGAVACKATASKPHFQFQLYLDGKDATFATDGRLNDKSKYKMDLGKWYHLVLMIDGKTRRYFVNGELIGIETDLPFIQPDYSPLEFGRDFYAATEFHIGALDDIRIYNRTLSLSEIKALYKADN